MRIVELSGGVGGARLARGLAALPDVDLTVVVNVGDDAVTHGLRVSPDLDTVVYTIAELEGPHGWGRQDDSFAFNQELARFGLDNTFQIGDRDLALKLFRTIEMGKGSTLSAVTESISHGFDLAARVLPVTDDDVRTRVRVADGWLSFQEYFVDRRHEDTVLELEFAGADRARAAPGVLDAIYEADQVIIGPSNPPLSIWPMLAVGGVRETIAGRDAVTAVSPLIGGKTVKGPADRVMASLGLPPGNRGVVAAYEGLIDRLVIHETDRVEAEALKGVEVVITDTLISEPVAAARLAAELVGR